MWQLSNSTPFVAERTWVRDRTGAEIWLVVVKGSFVIDDNGVQHLAPQPAAVSRAPRFRGDPLQSSLLCECDLVQHKRMTDVLVEGCAVAPGTKPAARVDVRLRVANIDKTLRVHGDRVCKPGLLGLGFDAARPFQRMPLVYERSFGGTHSHAWVPANPVGVGSAPSRSALNGKPAPNIEHPQHPFKDHDKGQPAGFGPIARHWMPRARFAGTYDEAWEATRKPLLPDDFDDTFYQCAPADQRVDGFLKGAEQVEVSGMTPGDGVLSFRIPRVPLVMTTRFYDKTQVEHRPVIHTLTVYPDQRRFDLVWHSALPCHRNVHKLEVTKIIQKRRVKVARAEIDSGMWMPA